MATPGTLTPRVALITASSAGLGAATAKAFASKGFNVVVNYHASTDKAEKLVTEITTEASDAAQHDLGVRALAVHADMSKRSDISHLVASTISQFGRLDVVVSNQGWTQMRNFANLDDNIDEADWDTCFNINLKSHLYLFYDTRPHLAATRGAFVTVASLAGVIPSGSSIVRTHSSTRSREN